MWYNGSTMDEVYTQMEGSTSNGHDADGTAWRDRNGVSAECPALDDPASEVPEVFQMPPVPTRRLLGRVRHVEPAPFAFVDELAE